MGAKLDIAGWRFGRLVALYPTNNRINGSIVWHCQCDCGNEKDISIKNLRMGKSNSCGCLNIEKIQERGCPTMVDLTGEKYNYLTAIQVSGKDQRGELKWLCKCDCGAYTEVLSSNLRTGHTISCGCVRMSRGENVIKQLLDKHNIQYEYNKPMFKFDNGRNAYFDFVIDNKYIVEYDGETHYTYNMHGWHNQDNLERQLKRDDLKNKWCFTNNIPIIRIPYTHFKDICIEDLLLETSKYIVTISKTTPNLTKE